MVIGPKLAGFFKSLKLQTRFHSAFFMQLSRCNWKCLRPSQFVNVEKIYLLNLLFVLCLNSTLGALAVILLVAIQQKDLM